MYNEEKELRQENFQKKKKEKRNLIIYRNIEFPFF